LELLLPPAVNEKEAIVPTIKELKLAINDARIIVIDDNSQDKTPVLAKDSCGSN
jgi:glycosyltransferase involved in cell wall biosynthesis